jgi:CNT family concentrative nucleoside transporter
MKKHFLILSFFFSITLTTFAQEFTGIWDFNSITNTQGDTLLKTNKKDFFELNENHTFHYELAAKNNLIAKGHWTYNNNLLSLIYKQPSDTIRTYKVTQNNEILILNESGINYTFHPKSKIRLTQIPIESESTFWNIIRGIIGIITLLLIAFAFSKDRKNINWTLVVKGLLLQFVFAIGILKVPFVESIFESISSGFIKVISFTQAGTDFLFASFITGKIEAPLVNFLVQVLPTIIFFSALTSLFYYLGILQRVVLFFAWVMY